MSLEFAGSALPLDAEGVDRLGVREAEVWEVDSKSLSALKEKVEAMSLLLQQDR